MLWDQAVSWWLSPPSQPQARTEQISVSRWRLNPWHLEVQEWEFRAWEKGQSQEGSPLGKVPRKR